MKILGLIYSFLPWICEFLSILESIQSLCYIPFWRSMESIVEEQVWSQQLTQTSNSCYKWAEVYGDGAESPSAEPFYTGLSGRLSCPWVWIGMHLRASFFHFHYFSSFLSSFHASFLSFFLLLSFFSQTINPSPSSTPSCLLNIRSPPDPLLFRLSCKRSRPLRNNNQTYHNKLQ